MKKFSLMIALVIVLGFVGCSLDKPGAEVVNDGGTVVVIMPNATNMISTSSNYVESLSNSVSVLFQAGWNTNSDYLRGLWVRNVTEFYDIYDVTDTTNYVGTVTNVWGIYDIFTNLTSEFTNVDVGTTNVDFTYQVTNWISQFVSDYTNTFSHTNAFVTTSTVTNTTTQLYGSSGGQTLNWGDGVYTWTEKLGHPVHYYEWKKGSSWYDIFKYGITINKSANIIQTNDIYNQSDVITSSYTSGNIGTVTSSSSITSTNAKRN